MDIDVQEQDETAITLAVTLPAKELDTQKKPALKQLGKNVEVKGFRKGHVPEDVLVTHIGESPLLEEMAQRAIHTALPHIIKEHDLRIVGRPHITVTKLAAGNPFEFKIEAALLPELTLPDYKKIAAAKNKENQSKQNKTEEVSEQEISDAIANIRTRVAEAEKEAGKTKGEKPELTDDFVQKLGPYKNIDDFKAQLKKQIQTHKEQLSREKHRLVIIEEIIRKADPKVPDILVDAELGKMLAQMRADIDRAGMKTEEYFKQIGKTEDDLRKEWRSDAEKRAKIQLVLNALAEKEDIHADKEAVENQTKLLLAQHPPNPPAGGGDMKQAQEATRIYVESMLTNERVFEFLENQKGKEEDKKNED